MTTQLPASQPGRPTPGTGSATPTVADPRINRQLDPCADPRADPLAAVLAELGQLLGALSQEQYVRRPVGVFTGSIGGHVRHCLDHVEALLQGVTDGELDYDHRERGTAVETDRLTAAHRVGELARQVAGVSADAMDRPVRICTAMSEDSPALKMPSTIGREFAFVLSHTIHHNAIIGAMARTLGVSVPERFGFAPSTLAFLKQASCVR